jgi:hypothetical protein
MSTPWAKAAATAKALTAAAKTVQATTAAKSTAPTAVGGYLPAVTTPWAPYSAAPAYTPAPPATMGGQVSAAYTPVPPAAPTAVGGYLPLATAGGMGLGAGVAGPQAAQIAATALQTAAQPQIAWQAGQPAAQAAPTVQEPYPGWYQDFIREHGVTPEEYYDTATTRAMYPGLTPLEVAIKDANWAGEFLRIFGRAPTQAEWERKWYSEVGSNPEAWAANWTQEQGYYPTPDIWQRYMEEGPWGWRGPSAATWNPAPAEQYPVQPGWNPPGWSY